MPLIDGTLGFQVRRMHPGAANAVPYCQDATDTVSGALKPIYFGTPVELTSGNAFKRATTLSGVVNDPKILGFSAMSIRDPQVGIEFAQLPIIKDATQRNFFGVYVAGEGNVFTGNLPSGTTSNVSVVGGAGLREQSNGTGLDPSFVVDPTASGQNGFIVQIIDIDPRDNGLLGGRVDFIVPGAKSQYLLGP